MRGDAAGDGDFAAFGVIGARGVSQVSVGVNLLLNGSMPLARSAASLALRCSINVSNELLLLFHLQTKEKHEFPRKVQEFV